MEQLKEKYMQQLHSTFIRIFVLGKLGIFWGIQNMDDKIRLDWEREISFQKHVKDTLPTLANITIKHIAFY